MSVIPVTKARTVPRTWMSAPGIRPVRTAVNARTGQATTSATARSTTQESTVPSTSAAVAVWNARAAPACVSARHSATKGAA